MKEFLFISLFMYSLCEVLFLEKYSETIALSISGCICLPLSDFKMGENINLIFSANNGGFSSNIYYGYSNVDDPTEATCDEIAVNTKKTDSTTYVEVYGTSESSTTNSYYYYIEKKQNDKYMLIKYEDFIGKYLLIESSRMSISWAALILIIVFSSIGFIILLIIAIKCLNNLNCKICEKKEKMSSDSIDYNQEDFLTSESK